MARGIRRGDGVVRNKERAGMVVSLIICSAESSSGRGRVQEERAVSSPLTDRFFLLFWALRRLR